MTREISDHNTIILDTMEGKESKIREFRFEKRWLKDDFMPRVARIWVHPGRAKGSLALFQAKLKMWKKNSQRVGCQHQRQRYQEEKRAHSAN
jgi:hypothetical protein